MRTIMSMKLSSGPLDLKEKNKFTKKFRAEMERSASRRSQRRAEIARGKREMTCRYELVDEDSEGEYEPE